MMVTARQCVVRTNAICADTAQLLRNCNVKNVAMRSALSQRMENNIRQLESFKMTYHRSKKNYDDEMSYIKYLFSVAHALADPNEVQKKAK